jgi:hypothetical protein
MDFVMDVSKVLVVSLQLRHSILNTVTSTQMRFTYKHYWRYEIWGSHGGEGVNVHLLGNNNVDLYADTNILDEYTTFFFSTKVRLLERRKFV